MLIKIIAIIALITIPLNLAYWHRSHTEPMRYRWDLTPYKSISVYLRHGVCGVHILTMPGRTAIRSEFEAPLRYDAIPNNASMMLSSKLTGPYRHTWLVFPFWAPALFLGFFGVLPVVQGPVRRWWRVRHGRCVFCGYDLRGSRSGACPECGLRYR